MVRVSEEGVEQQYDQKDQDEESSNERIEAYHQKVPQASHIATLHGRYRMNKYKWREKRQENAHSSHDKNQRYRTVESCKRNQQQSSEYSANYVGTIQLDARKQSSYFALSLPESLLTAGIFREFRSTCITEFSAAFTADVLATCHFLDPDCAFWTFSIMQLQHPLLLLFQALSFMDSFAAFEAMSRFTSSTSTCRVSNEKGTEAIRLHAGPRIRISTQELKSCEFSKFFLRCLIQQGVNRLRIKQDGSATFLKALGLAKVIRLSSDIRQAAFSAEPMTTFGECMQLQAIAITDSAYKGCCSRIIHTCLLNILSRVNQPEDSIKLHFWKLTACCHNQDDILLRYSQIKVEIIE